MVSRSALNRVQISDETSSMISSMLEVAWILFVTFCRFFENTSLALTSAGPAAAAVGVFRTALIVTSSIDSSAAGGCGNNDIFHTIRQKKPSAPSGAPGRVSPGYPSRLADAAAGARQAHAVI